MNTIERRALYNLLRMNWLTQREVKVEPWQVEDYRNLPLTTLLERLKEFNIDLNRTSFIAFADDSDSPEQLTDLLIGEQKYTTAQEDRIYLLVFELWRRLMSEKPSLSVICNELDEYIYQYDNNQLDNPLALQDALSHFICILEENVDEGVDPNDVIGLISNYCANDIEAFLYDFIFEQIDSDNESYAQELLDAFELFLHNNKWFKLLRIRLTDERNAQLIADEIFEEHLDENDLPFNLEFFAILAEKELDASFKQLLKKSFSMIQKEEDFQDLLIIAIDYLHRLDRESDEMILQKILNHRKDIPLDTLIFSSDPIWHEIKKIFKII